MAHAERQGRQEPGGRGGYEDPSEAPIRASLPPEADDLPRSRRVHQALWFLLPLVAVAELIGHGVIVARVPTDDDWTQAAAHVRSQLEEKDRVVSVPYWTDPLLRHHLGDEMSMAMAGASDNANYERIFELSIRGHRSKDVPGRDPDATTRFGRVTVNRWDLGPSTVKYDFVHAIRGAVVEKVTNGAEEPCAWRRSAIDRRAGLAQGSITPAERFVCDSRALWVATTVVENLDYRPHFCINQHPSGREPIRATFRDVPLGERLVIYGGLYNRHEREGTGAAITARVLVDGAPIGELVHRDGDGWKYAVLHTRTAEAAAAAPTALGDVSVEVTTPDNGLRSFCWSATIRAGQREGEL